MAEKWTNTSFDPSSGVMNPKPLVPLNHFTTPSAMAKDPSVLTLKLLDGGTRMETRKRLMVDVNPSPGDHLTSCRFPTEADAPRVRWTRTRHNWERKGAARR